VGRRRHAFIFRSLHSSAFDVCGQIDAGAAREVLEKLALPASTDGLDELARELAAGKRSKNRVSGVLRRRKRERRDRRAPRRG
jgi:hypothetical protein